MSLLVVYTSSTTTTTLAQSIIDRVSLEVRGLLGNSGIDATLMVGWVDDVHKEILRRCRWGFLLSGVYSFDTVSGSSDYYIGGSAAPVGSVDTALALSDIFTVKEDEVYDRTNHQILGRVMERPLSSDLVTTITGYPKFYRSDSSQPDILQLIATPNGAFSIEFRYYKQRKVITATTDTLQVPDGYSDVVFYGVCSRAFKFLEENTNSQLYGSKFTDGVRQMIMDANNFPKYPNSILPDSN